MRISEYKLSENELVQHNYGKYGHDKICHNCDEECKDLYYYRTEVFFCWWCINEFKDSINLEM